MAKFDTSKEALEEFGILLTDEQYSDLFIINLMMVGSTGKISPIYCILLILKTLGLIPTKVVEDKTGENRNDDSDNNFQDCFQRKFGRFKD